MIFQASSRRGKPQVALFLLAIISYFLALALPSHASLPSISATLEPPRTTPQQQFSVVITVPENHHAYLDSGDEGYYIPISIDFEKPDAPSLVSSPEGEREEEVGATVIRGKGAFRYQLNASEEGTLPFSIQSQICNDETKVCYAPHTLSLLLEIAGEEKVAATTKAEEDLDVSGWIGKKFEEHSQNLLLAFFLVMLAGLLSAATPCVYPMLPVTAAILTARGNGDKREGWLHSLAYFVGIVITYFLLGYVAGMTGGVLNSVMQNPVTNILIALFFVLFALAMFDLFNFSFFQEIGDKVNTMTSGKSSYSATVAMGIAAGIIVSPCVGPIVFAILLQVADRIAELTNQLLAAGEQIGFFQKSLIAFKGSVIMAGFGIGLGIPFLLVGLLSNKMPRSGQWMVYVKYAMGALILLVAYLYFLKGFQGAGANAEFAKLLTFALMAFFGLTGLIHCFQQKKKGFPCDSIKSATFGMLLLGGLAMTAVAGLNQTKGDDAIAASGNTMTVTKGNLTWHRDYENALKEAKETGKPLFIDFFAFWCANCLAFDKLTTSDTVLNNALQKAVLLKIHDTDPVFEEFKRNKDYRELTIGLPFFVILRPDESLFWKTTRYDGIEDFRQQIIAAGIE